MAEFMRIQPERDTAHYLSFLASLCMVVDLENSKSELPAFETIDRWSEEEGKSMK